MRDFWILDGIQALESGSHVKIILSTIPDQLAD